MIFCSSNFSINNLNLSVNIRISVTLYLKKKKEKLGKDIGEYKDNINKFIDYFKSITKNEIIWKNIAIFALFYYDMIEIILNNEQCKKTISYLRDNFKDMNYCENLLFILYFSHSKIQQNYMNELNELFLIISEIINNDKRGEIYFYNILHISARSNIKDLNLIIFITNIIQVLSKYKNNKEKSIKFLNKLIIIKKNKINKIIDEIIAKCDPNITIMDYYKNLNNSLFINSSSEEEDNNQFEEKINKIEEEEKLEKIKLNTYFKNKVIAIVSIFFMGIILGISMKNYKSKTDEK